MIVDAHSHIRLPIEGLAESRVNIYGVRDSDINEYLAGYEKNGVDACFVFGAESFRQDSVIQAENEALARLIPSPVVELNRAVAVAMAFGPAKGLALVDVLTAEPSLKNYHLLPAVRGDLLAKLGRAEEARVEFERAASLTRNARERDLMLGRAAAARRQIGAA